MKTELPIQDLIAAVRLRKAIADVEDASTGNDKAESKQNTLPCKVREVPKDNGIASEISDNRIEFERKAKDNGFITIRSGDGYFNDALQWCWMFWCHALKQSPVPVSVEHITITRMEAVAIIRKLGFVVRDYPDDKESKKLGAELKARVEAL